MSLCGGFPFKNSASSTAHLLCYEQQKKLHFLTDPFINYMYNVFINVGLTMMSDLE